MNRSSFIVPILVAMVGGCTAATHPGLSGVSSTIVDRPPTAGANASIAPCASSVVPGDPGAQNTRLVAGAPATTPAAASAIARPAAAHRYRAELTP